MTKKIAPQKTPADLRVRAFFQKGGAAAEAAHHLMSKHGMRARIVRRKSGDFVWCGEDDAWAMQVVLFFIGSGWGYRTYKELATRAAKVDYVFAHYRAPLEGLFHLTPSTPSGSRDGLLDRAEIETRLSSEIGPHLDALAELKDSPIKKLVDAFMAPEPSRVAPAPSRAFFAEERASLEVRFRSAANETPAKKGRAKK